MFEGIIRVTGIVNSVIDIGNNSKKIFVKPKTNNFLHQLNVGDSVACNGICLTIIGFHTSAAKEIFVAEVSSVTVSSTNIRNWAEGQEINLERSLAVGGTINGHFVTGGVDGVAQILSITPVDNLHQLQLSAPEEITKYIMKKGTVALDGVSLTVYAANRNEFTVYILPYSWENTTFRNKTVGDHVNVEANIIAKYVERLLESRDWC